MNKKLFDYELGFALNDEILLYAEAMQMVSYEYGSSLSHEEFMDKAEEYYCKLLEEGNKPFSENKEKVN